MKHECKTTFAPGVPLPWPMPVPRRPNEKGGGVIALTPKQVKEIRRFRDEGKELFDALAAKYGISRRLVYRAYYGTGAYKGYV